MTPEGRQQVYNEPWSTVRETWPFAHDLAEKAGFIDETALRELARSLRSVYPGRRWREMLLENLTARIAGDTSVLTFDERQARGWTSITREIEGLRGRLEGILASAKTPEDQRILLKGALVGALQTRKEL